MPKEPKVPEQSEPSPPGSLYHYTDVGGLYGVLTSKVLWSTHMAYLNDARELHYGVSEAGKHLDTIRKMVSDRPESFPNNYVHVIALLDTLRADIPKLVGPILSRLADLYVTCFCTRGDLLSQWRGYSGSGGYAIEFDVTDLTKSIKRLPPKSPNVTRESDRPVLVKVEYGADELQKVVQSLLFEMGNKIQTEMVDLRGDFLSGMRDPLDNALAGILGASARVKDPAFDEENEYRIIALVPQNDAAEACHYYPGKIGLTPRVHISFPPSSVKKIIVGPGDFATNRRASVEHFLSTHQDYAAVKVEESSIPFREV